MKYFDIDYLVDEFSEYSDMDLYDIAMEIADRNVDIYNSVLLNWLKNDTEAVESMAEVGMIGLIDLTDYDVYKHIQVAQFNLYYNEIIENLNEIEERLKEK